MIKHVCKISFMFLISFIAMNSVLSYDYVDPKNQSKVEDMIRNIYDIEEQYEDLVGATKEDEINIIGASSNSYWWPIGSRETVSVNGKDYATGDPEVINITSSFGYRKDPFGSGSTKYHSGIDIAHGNAYNTVNIIAAKDGIVVYPTANVKNNCPSSSGQSSCGGGYGNYVIIQHSDGNYTLYAHLYEGSITVKEGEAVKQGQVIAKMGCSGNSTGTHLHFEVREGTNAYKSAVNPLNYISSDNPRSISKTDDDEFLSWVNSWEGATYYDSSNYLVENIGDGVKTVGYGVTLENDKPYFETLGININDYPVGSTMPVDLVNKVELMVLDKHRSAIEKTLADNSITLQYYQIDALASMRYNCGNISGFVSNYKKYGNTEDFYENWFLRCVSKGTKFEKGLTRRRNAEWTLFHTGEYVYNK